MYQIPPLSNEYVFEDFVCDIFNKIHNTFSFHKYGVKGQKQDGIDIFYAGSSKERIVIQCKKKDIRKPDEENRDSILKDIKSDFEKSKSLEFEFSCFILASTYKSDAKIQEKVTKYSEEENMDIQYWGWDTIISYLINYPDLIKKYYPAYENNLKNKDNSIYIYDRSDSITKYPLGFLNINDDSEIFSLIYGETYIGRSNDNHIYFNKMSISRKHCMIDAGENIFLIDLGSTYGTFLNEIKINSGEKYELKSNDKIRIGLANEEVNFLFFK